MLDQILLDYLWYPVRKNKKDSTTTTNKLMLKWCWNPSELVIWKWWNILSDCHNSVEINSLLNAFRLKKNIKFKQKMSKINCKCIFGFFQVLKVCSEFTWKFSDQPETTQTHFSSIFGYLNSNTLISFFLSSP